MPARTPSFQPEPAWVRTGPRSILEQAPPPEHFEYYRDTQATDSRIRAVSGRKRNLQPPAMVTPSGSGTGLVPPGIPDPPQAVIGNEESK